MGPKGVKGNSAQNLHKKLPHPTPKRNQGTLSTKQVLHIYHLLRALAECSKDFGTGSPVFSVSCALVEAWHSNKICFSKLWENLEQIMTQKIKANAK